MPDIVFDKICKGFAGQPVLRDISARLPRQGTTALMGPSGSGKTTFTRLLLGLEKPDAGAVTGHEGLRFSCVFQEDRLVEELSALDNAALVLARPRLSALRRAFAAVGLAEEDLHKPVRALSGGQRRRVALVRALEAESDYLVLDEALKELDADNHALCMEYLQSRRGTRGLLLVTHNPAEAAVCSQTVLLPVPPEAPPQPQ